MNLKDWIEKWSNYYWMPSDPRLQIKNLTVEHFGQLNLMWVLMGRKTITQGFFDQNLDKWELAGKICLRMIDGVPIREYATIYNEREFYAFVKKHPEVFASYLPMTTWDRMFKTSAARKIRASSK